MANVSEFNYPLDKITERETVFDFVERLGIGVDFVNPNYNGATNDIDKQIIFEVNTKVKNGILAQIIATLPISDLIKLDVLKTSFKDVPIGATTVTIAVPETATLYKIIQEKTGQDVTSCFSRVGSTCTTTFDVPMINTDIFKAYYYL
jgi:hypothetical protein